MAKMISSTCLTARRGGGIDAIARIGRVCSNAGVWGLRAKHVEKPLPYGVALLLVHYPGSVPLASCASLTALNTASLSGLARPICPKTAHTSGGLFRSLPAGLSEGPTDASSRVPKRRWSWLNEPPAGMPAASRLWVILRQRCPSCISMTYRMTPPSLPDLGASPLMQFDISCVLLMRYGRTVPQ